MVAVARAPEPRFVVAPDGVRLATYDSGDPDGPTVLAVHGFASSASANWYATGWVRELERAGRRVLSFDQRGHGVERQAARARRLLDGDPGRGRAGRARHLPRGRGRLRRLLARRPGRLAHRARGAAPRRPGGARRHPRRRSADPVPRRRGARRSSRDGTPIGDRLTRGLSHDGERHPGQRPRRPDLARRGDARRARSPTRRTRRGCPCCSRPAPRIRSSRRRSGSRPRRRAARSSPSPAATTSTRRPPASSGSGRSRSWRRRHDRRAARAGGGAGAARRRGGPACCSSRASTRPPPSSGRGGSRPAAAAKRARTPSGPRSGRCGRRRAACSRASPARSGTGRRSSRSTATIVEQTEDFFCARTPHFEPAGAALTDLEHRSTVRTRWWSLAEIEATEAQVFPETLADLLRDALRRLPAGLSDV